uniref:Uncharacterized protein n=1 Tax=Anopheles atroparvus TaxID=41427 RepID=A0A182J5A4_ANOAO
MLWDSEEEACSCLDNPHTDTSPEVPVDAHEEAHANLDDSPAEEFWGPPRPTEENLQAVLGEIAWACTALAPTPKPIPEDVVSVVAQYQRGYLPLSAAHAILVDRCGCAILCSNLYERKGLNP